jgi:hypothetical protein
MRKYRSENYLTGQQPNPLELATEEKKVITRYTSLATSRALHALCALATPINAPVRSCAYRGDSAYSVTSGSALPRMFRPRWVFQTTSSQITPRKTLNIQGAKSLARGF